MDLYHLNDIFPPPGPIRLRAPASRGAGTGDCFGIQCTLTVCWSSLAACSASALLPIPPRGRRRERDPDTPLSQPVHLSFHQQCTLHTPTRHHPPPSFFYETCVAICDSGRTDHRLQAGRRLQFERSFGTLKRLLHFSRTTLLADGRCAQLSAPS